MVSKFRKKVGLLIAANLVLLTVSCTDSSNGEAGPEPINILSEPFEVFDVESAPEVFSFIEGDQGSILSNQRGFFGYKEILDDFELTLEYWTDQGANSGVFIRCQEPGAYSPRSCYEVNIADTHETEASRTGSIVRFAPPAVELQTAERWVTMKIVAKGNQILVDVDGQTTVNIEDDSFATGYLAFQFGGNEKLIKFRNIQLLTID